MAIFDFGNVCVTLLKGKIHINDSKYTLSEAKFIYNSNHIFLSDWDIYRKKSISSVLNQTMTNPVYLNKDTQMCLICNYVKYR